MANSKILILREKQNQYFLKYTNGNIQPMYKERKNVITKILFKILFKFNSDFLFIFLEDWKKEINNYEKVIIFDSGYRSIVSKYIRIKNKKCKIILYFWNIVKDNNKKILQDKNITEIWTFDNEDSLKYNIKLNQQFYTKNITLPMVKEENDVYFLGKNKGRKQEIQKIEKKLKEYGVKTKFIVLEENSKKQISYEEYLKEIQNTKAILDVSEKKQKGLTLRCLEALFLHKKLITTNMDICKFDFYNKNNIFIIGKDDIKDIIKFINSEYYHISEKIINYYDFENWIKRFE